MKSPAEINYYLSMGLVGNNVELYQTNAVFKAAVDTLATMIPLLMETIVNHSISEQKVLDAYKEHDKLIANPFPGLGDEGSH